MSNVAFPVDLQDSVANFCQALRVPEKLLAIHPRKQGNPGNFAALGPAILTNVISAFEGYVEDFTAKALYVSGHNFAQVANQVGKWNNPTVDTVAKTLSRAFPTIAGAIGTGFSVEIYAVPPPGKRWWVSAFLAWPDAVRDAEGWMQVRHCLAHGLTTGWGSEVWPGPLSRDPNAVSAASVLRPMPKPNTHSLTLHGALSGSNIYVSAAKHLSELVAAQLGHKKLDWSKLPYLY